MLSRILILVIISRYYKSGDGDTDARAYIEFPKGTLTVRYAREPLGGDSRFFFLVFDGTFTEDHHCLLNLGRKTRRYYRLHAGDTDGEFYGFLEGEKERTKLKSNTRLRYEYHEETMTKQEPYIAIRYASFEAIQIQINDVFQNIDKNKKYYTQPSYAISHGTNGHFIQFIESHSSCPINPDLSIRELLGSVSEEGDVVKITGSTIKPSLLVDMYFKIPSEDTKGVLGIRMAEIGVLAKRDGKNEVMLFTPPYYGLMTRRMISLRYGDLKFDGMSSCFDENPPAPLEKGFKFVIKGHVFIKRCGYPTDTDDRKVTQHGKQILIDIAIVHPKTKFIYFVDDLQPIQHSSSQLFFDSNSNWYMISANTKIMIDKSAEIYYRFFTYYGMNW